MRNGFAALAMGVGLTLAPLLAVADDLSPQGRPYGVDDLLKMEAFGQVSLDPKGSRVVFERQKPFEAAPVFDHDFYNTVLRSDLYVADVGRPGPARRLLADGEGSGQVLGAWSPSGRRLLVYRLRDRHWTAGVVEAATGAVQWLDLSPELPAWGRSVQWLSDDRLLMVVRTDGKSPWRLRAAWEPQARLHEAWAQTREGSRPARTMVGSGAFRDRTPSDADDALVEVDLASGSRRTLARGLIYDIEASPNGRRVAVARYGEELPVEADQPFLQGQFPRRRTLDIVDIETGAVWAPLGGRDLLPNLLSWSASSADLLVWTRERGDWAMGRLVSVSAGPRKTVDLDLGGLAPALTETGLRTPVVRAAWLGDRPLFYGRSQNGRPDWYAVGEAQPIALTAQFRTAPDHIAVANGDRPIVAADGDLWRLSLFGALERLTTFKPAVYEAGRVDLGQRFTLNDAAPPSAMTYQNGGALWRLGADGRRAQVAQPPAEARLVAVGAQAAAWLETDDHYRQSLVVGTNRGSIPIAGINAAYGDIAFARRRAVHHRGPSGEPLISWLYLPAIIRGAPPPLIVVPYPGESNKTPDPVAEPLYTATMISVPVLTGAGYAVLVPSLPRTAFPDGMAQGLAEQVLAVVDAATPQCDCDPRRLVLWGHSFGGHAVMSIASQTDRFSAVVAENGIYDLVSGWGAFAPQGQRVLPENGLSIRARAGWMETGQGRMGAPPWRDLDRYVRNSPLFQVDKITAPVLLVNSDLDYISPGQAEEMFSALYRLNKDAVLLTYYGEGHVFASPANIRDLMTTSLDWVQDVLASGSAAGRRTEDATDISLPEAPPTGQSQARSQDSIRASIIRSP